MYCFDGVFIAALKNRTGASINTKNQTVGNYQLESSAYPSTLIRVRVYQPILPEYPLLVFRAYIRSGRFTKEGTITTNIAHLSAGRFAQIEYPLPPLEEQAEIVKEAERRISIINMLDGELDKGMRRADRLRQSILGQAFRGLLMGASH